MDKKTPVEVLFNVATYGVAFANFEEILKIISLILSIITSLAILLAKIIQWWKKASKDGKIDKDEINEGIDIIVSGGNEIIDNIKDKEE